MRFQIHCFFLSALALLHYLGRGRRVIGLPCCACRLRVFFRVAHLISGARNIARIQHGGRNARHLNAPGQARRKRRSRGVPVVPLRLGLEVHRLGQALLPQRQRRGKRHINVRVEPQCIPDRQARTLERALHHPLQIQQRNIRRLSRFGEPDSNRSQNRHLPAAYLRRSRCTRGCTAAWSARPAPFGIPAPGTPCSRRSPGGSRA